MKKYKAVIVITDADEDCDVEGINSFIVERLRYDTVKSVKIEHCEELNKKGD